MKWRCPECGKPHEKNDPPCDNCGHHKFERAVVPQASSDNTYEQFVWACSECGRHHQRNNPPCSRCGNATFEKKTLDAGEFEPGSTSSYLDLAGRLEVGAALVVVALVVIGALGFFGVIDVPGITPQGPPTVENVPGNSDTVADVSLDDVETSLVMSLNDGRETRLERTGGLDTVSTFVNRRVVKNTYTDADKQISREQLQRFDVSCSGSLSFAPARTFSPVTANATAETVATMLLPQISADLPADTSKIGLATHAGPDGKVFVMVAYCQAADS